MELVRDNMQGKVIFMGGGPGDPELLTIKADKVIKTADTIIYAGSLVNKDVLNSARDDAEIYNSAGMDLKEIIQQDKDSFSDNHQLFRVYSDKIMACCISFIIRLKGEYFITLFIVMRY